MLKELKIHHREVARLRFEGFKPDEIAERTNTKLQTVYSILRDPVCKSYMAGLSDRADSTVLNVRQKLAEMNSGALAALSDLLDPGNNIPPAVVLNTAKDVLDRNGYKAAEKYEHLVGHFTAEDIMKLKERAETVDLDYMN